MSRRVKEPCPICQETMAVISAKTREGLGIYRTFYCETHGKWTSSPLDPALRRPGERPLGWQGQQEQERYVVLRQQMAVKAKEAAKIRQAEAEEKVAKPKQEKAAKTGLGSTKKSQTRKDASAPKKSTGTTVARQQQPSGHVWRPAKSEAKPSAPKQSVEKTKPAPRQPRPQSTWSRADDLRLAREYGITVEELLA